MPQYSRPDIDLSTRTALAIEMLTPIPERPWGWVTQMAQTCGVSRTLLYKIRDHAREALSAALAPHQAGPQPQPKDLVLDPSFLRRTITVSAMLKGSVRDIQQGLALILGVSRSMGYISQVLQEAGRAAQEHNTTLTLPLPVLGEADEIFQGRRPCLTVVDGRSFLVLHLSPADHRDATTWGVTFLDLLERGIHFQDLASDGGKGIRAGAREAQLLIPRRPDLFHLLREAYGLGQPLERAAYRAIQWAERARRAEQEAQTPRRRRGRRLKVVLTSAQVQQREEQAVALYDLFTWLVKELRRGLEPLTSEGRLTTAVQATATVETVVELLQQLHHQGISAWARKLQDHVEELLAPLLWLEQSLSSWRQTVDADTEAFIGWTWLHRQELAVEVAKDFPESVQPVVRAFWEALSVFHRSSSLAESLHSWLRPYLEIHRGMPRWLTPLLQVFWNHHPFQRGKRAGHSPLQLAGVAEAPSLSEVFDRLLCPVLSQTAA